MGLGNSQFFDLARTSFAASADGWLIAFAKAKDFVLVTQEEHAPLARNRIPIPNVCEQFGVDYCDTIHMLRDLNVQFDWTPMD